MKRFGLFGKKNREIEVPTLERPGHLLAFVLLREPYLPPVTEIANAFAEFGGRQNAISEVSEGNQESGDSDEGTSVVMLDVEGVGRAFVALMPVAVPNGEAEAAFDYSLASISDEAVLEEHSAHLMITLMGEDSISPTDAVMEFTTLLAAVAKVSPTTGIYWGNAGATHPVDFFLDVAREQSISPRIMLWSGFSRAGEPDGNLSLLSLGMHQLALPELYLVTPPEKAGASIQWFYDLLGYVAGRGEPIPNGDTIGVDENHRLKVEYTNSPANDGSVVWSIRV